MQDDGRCGVVFLTAPPDEGRAILASVRGRFPQVRWTVYFRASDRSALGDALAGTEPISDKPAGSRIDFVQSIRQRRFDLAIFAWTGHTDHNRMKLVGLLSGARHRIVYDHDIESFDLDDGVLVWLRHVAWRLSLGVRPILAMYKWTLGLAVAQCRFWLRSAARRRGATTRTG